MDDDTASVASLMSGLRVVLVDDHEVVRAGLKALIDSDPEIEVVGEAGTAEEGVRRVGTALRFDSARVLRSISCHASGSRQGEKR